MEVYGMAQLESLPERGQSLPAFSILGMMQGMWVARSVYVATKFGVPDLLDEGPKSTQELAEITRTHEPTLYRLLRALASQGVFIEVGQRSFAHTALSRALRSNMPGSIRDEVILFGEKWKWAPWEELGYSVQTGETAFNRYHGVNIFEYLSQHAEDGNVFDLGMTSFSQLVNQPVVDAYDFSSFTTIVDIGGGHGSQLMAILKAYPNLKGILFERLPVIEGAREHIEESLKGRCELVAGDFFGIVPEGADAYIIKQCLHNWDDGHCIEILQACRRAMRSDSKMLIADRVIVPDTAGDPFNKFNKYWDLVMLTVAPGGRERTEAEFMKLYEAAGFKLTRIIPTKSPHCIIEGIPV